MLSSLVMFKHKGWVIVAKKDEAKRSTSGHMAPAVPVKIRLTYVISSLVIRTGHHFLNLPKYLRFQKDCLVSDYGSVAIVVPAL